MIKLDIRLYCLSGIALLLILVAAACFRPQESLIPQQDPGVLYTVAAQTAAVHLTQVGRITPSAPAGQTPSPEMTPGGPPSAATPAGPEPGGANGRCDQIRFIKDVTIPDDQDLRPGEAFTKTWRLENAGTCPWTIGYLLVFEKGDALGAPATTSLTNQTIPPGETVDVTVEMTAPEEVGSYQGYWKIRNVRGDTFGLGEFDQPFWVKINVVEGSGVRYDFNVYAGKAAWGAGEGPVNYQGPGEKSVFFDQEAEAGDPQVRLEQDQPLEGGGTSGVLLFTKPGVGEGSYLVGRFPPYTVNNDDLLSGRVGLLENAPGNCGSGSVTFKIDLTQEGDPSSRNTIWEGRESCDGQTQAFEVGLDAYRGKKVTFYLTAAANDGSGENYAVWDSLVVRR